MFSYDPRLLTELDWVRFQIADTAEAKAQFADEEIQAVIDNKPASSGRRYFVAAELLERSVISWAGRGSGISERQLGKMRLKSGIGASGDGSIGGVQARIKSLIATGARLDGRTFVRSVGRKC